MYLNCHSYFSLKYGTFSPEDLVKHAGKLNIKTLCLTDINISSGLCDFVRACQKESIKPVWGIEFRDEDEKLLWIGIARNNQGVVELNRHLSAHSLDQIPLAAQAPTFENVFVIYPFSSPFRELKPYEFIGVRWFEVPRLYSSLWKNSTEKLVAMQPVTFLNKEGFVTHQLLRSIHQNTLLSKLDRRNIAHKSERLVSEERLAEKFTDYPEMVAKAQWIMNECELSLDLEAPKNKKTFTESKKEDRILLEKLAWEGFEMRYGKGNTEAFQRIEKELAIIEKMDFLAYFLITHDIVQYAISRGYYHVGRGSGANSIVAYCLRLTDVDPIELDLYFERFINPYRASPPDFDIDFSWDERDEITSYIFTRYGSDHVALLATYATFQRKAIIRELCKVYGLIKKDIDKMVDEPESADQHPLAEEIKKHGEKLIDFPNHLSIHAGGVLITEEPICQYTALLLMPKGFPTTHFDMHVAEENGFYKYDILSQRGLGHIKEAVYHIQKNKGISINIRKVRDFMIDPVINERLSTAQTTGCFYIESPAMRGLITKLKCDNYLTLVAASSVIRPGVASSGMMREFISRHNKRGNIAYLHETFREHLGETYGVMVYQEDVIKIAHHFGGLDLGQADVLRRVMSGKSRGKKIAQLEHDFFKNCREKGHSEELAKEVWRQIESFAGFSFCKAHSATYAVESYQSLFLKTYYPHEFIVGVINNFGGFFDTELYVNEARMSGAIVEAPCVNHSEYLTSIEGSTIYLGFIHLKNLQTEVAKQIVKERGENGEYLSLEDFILRTAIRKEQLVILIRIGALRFTGRSKQELLWEKNSFAKNIPVPTGTKAIFESPNEVLTLPPLEIDPLEFVYDQIDLLGFPLISPFDLLKTKFRGELPAKHLMQHVGKTVRMVGYYVCKKDLRTNSGKHMGFGTWLDMEGRFFDTVHFPASLAQYPFKGKGCYLILGKIVEDFGFASIEVGKMDKLPTKLVGILNL